MPISNVFFMVFTSFMRTREGHGTATAIPDSNQQPYCPPGTLLGAGTRCRSGFPAPAGYRRRYHRSRRRRSSLYLFCDNQLLIQAFESLRIGKKTDLPAAKPGAPVSPPDADHRRSARIPGGADPLSSPEVHPHEPRIRDGEEDDGIEGQCYNARPDPAERILKGSSLVTVNPLDESVDRHLR